MIAVTVPGHWKGVRRITIFSLATIGLALLHVLPARHHLADMASRFNLSDAWKGIGAAVAIAVLALPFENQAKVVAFLKRRKWLGAAALLLVVVHLVPAADHVPKLLAAPSFGDAWKAIGSVLAIAWFLAPRSVHVAVLQVVTRAQGRRVRVATAVVAAGAVLVACMK